MSKLRNKSMRIFNFLGQHSADQDKVDLYNPKKAEAYGTKCSMLIGRDGKPDSRYLGTDTLLVNLSSYGYCLRSFTWKAYDGNSYTMMYCRNAAGACFLVYVVNETWGTIIAPTPANYFDDQDTPVVYSALPFMPPQTLPGFAVDTAGNMFVALGVSGIFRAEIRNGVLYFYLTRMPFSSFIDIDSGRSWISPMDLPDSAWSAVGDLARYTPKPVEMDADPPTYGVDYHYQLALLGGKGAQMVGGTTWGRAKVRWTEDDCYMIFGTGNDGQTQAARIGNGYGLAGYLGYVEWNDTLYWFSKYNGGAYLAATYGSAPEGTGVLDRIAIGSDYAVTIYDAGYQIADVWQAAGEMTSKVKKVSWGEWGDWNNIPAAQRTGLSIETIRGSVGLTNPNAVIASTPHVSGGNSWALIGGTEANMVDSAPLYPSKDTPSPTYAVYKDSSPHPLRDEVFINLYGGSGLLWKQYKSSIYDRSSTWMEYNILGSVSHIQIDFRCGEILRFTLSPNGYVGYLRFFLVVNVEAKEISIGEIRLEGSAVKTATLYTEAPTATSKAVLTGLTASSQRDLGMFWARFIGTGSEYVNDLAISIRCGTVALAAYDTASPDNTWTDWYTLTTRELRRGKPLRELLFKTLGTELTASFGGLLYVQAKAVFSLDSQGNSPELDFMVFTAITGDNITSVFPAAHNDKHQFISFKKSTSSTGNDVEAVRSITEAWSVLYNKENTSYLSLADRTIMAFAGFCGALQYAGLRAYYGASNLYRALLGEFTTPALAGRLQGGKLAVGVKDYTSQGKNMDTVFPDESGKTWTADAGGPETVTAQSVFGGASAHVSANSDLLSTPYHDDFDFGAGDFTIDCRFRYTITNSVDTLDIFKITYSTGAMFKVKYYNKKIQFVVYTDGDVYKAEYYFDWAAIVTDTWYHVELVRSGSTMYCFVDGVALTATVTVAIGTNNLTMDGGTIVSVASNSNRAAWIDEMRILKGTAAHTATFTPPTAAYTYDRSQAVLLHFDGDNALKIYAKKDSSNLTRYDSPVAITNLQILPKGLSMQAGSNSRAAELAVDVQSYSGFKLDSIEFTAEDSTYN